MGILWGAVVGTVAVTSLALAPSAVAGAPEVGAGVSSRAASTSTVSDPSGLTATTTLSFSRSQPDPVTLTWPDPGPGFDFFLRFENYLHDPLSTDVGVGVTCNGSTCSWSGELADVSSGDTVHVDLRQLVDGGTQVVEQRDRWHGALLPADPVKPTITVKIPKRTVAVGRPIRLKVSFSDNQTEFGWLNDECAPGGDCYHPDWFPLMSLDKGKKWSWFTDTLFSRKARKVHVWIKWPDEALNMSAIYKSPRLAWTKAR